MKKKSHIAQFKQGSKLLIGLLAAFMLLTQQPIAQYMTQSEGDEISQTTEQTQDTEERAPQESVKVLAYEVLVPVMNFNLFHSFDLLIELPSLEDTGSGLVENTLQLFDSFLDNLFNRIIAPNAP